MVPGWTGNSDFSHHGGLQEAQPERWPLERCHFQDCPLSHHSLLKPTPPGVGGGGSSGLSWAQMRDAQKVSQMGHTANDLRIHSAGPCRGSRQDASCCCCTRVRVGRMLRAPSMVLRLSGNCLDPILRASGRGACLSAFLCWRKESPWPANSVESWDPGDSACSSHSCLLLRRCPELP